MGQTVTASSVVDQARGTVASRTVLIRSNTTGVVPMERRLPDGSKNVSRCDYNAQGKMVNRVDVRPLDFGATGAMVLNPRNHDDAALLAECRLWLEQGDDERFPSLKVWIEENGGNAEGTPIPRYDKYKPEALVKRINEEVDLIGDDPVAVREFLEACARYELQRSNPDDARVKPRKSILDALDSIGASSGVEYGMDAVEDE
jgi:hypothetical protein